MEIGSILKQLRKKSNLTQQALANKCGLSRGYLADLESNRYNPSIETLQIISTSLNVPITIFFKEENILTNNAVVINKEEQEFLKLFLKLEKKEKVLITQLINALLKNKKD